MEFSNLKDKKKFIIGALVLVALLAYFLVFKPFGKTDDWKYSHVSEQQWLIYGGIAIGAIILSWLIISIYLIIKGKPDESGVNAKRKLGIWLLVSPFVLVAIGFGLLFFGFEIGILAIPIIVIVLMIGGIVYAIKKHVKIALIPLIMIPIIVVGFGGVIGYFGVLSPARFMAAGSINENLGFSVGGAKDVENFRKNIENNYLPAPTDITYEGLFYDYYFNTGEQKACTKLFCPSYSSAISKDPFSKQDEYYLSVGLNSNIKESDFKRKKLNLVIVLDISGSMSSPFNQYYYDQFGKRQQIEGITNDSDYQKSKMQVATKSIVALLEHLNPDDRFGMVLYDNDAYLGKPLSEVADTDLDSIKGHILEIAPRGSTNFEAGYKKGTSLFDDYLNVDQTEYENRIIFLTDAMPNMGDIDENGLFGLTKKNSESKVYTTFIGVGVDFNTELIDYITKIRGANYYSVHSSSEFKNRMDNEFEYMVTPLVFNLTLTLDAQGYQIEKVYGSPEANEATGEIMKVNTLFPSKQKNGETRGGLVLLKLKKISNNDNIKIKVYYEDRLGKIDGQEETFQFLQKTSDTYDNTGIRKGILLSRYVNLMKDWINDERASITKNQPVTPVINKIDGIVLPPEDQPAELGRWERQSVPLQVSTQYKSLFSEFKPYFESEMNAIEDSSLSKETAILSKLETYQP